MRTRQNDSFALRYLFDQISEHRYLVGTRQVPEGNMKLTQLYGVDPQFKEAVDIVLTKIFALFPPSEDAPEPVSEDDDDIDLAGIIDLSKVSKCHRSDSEDCPIHRKKGILAVARGEISVEEADLEDIPPELRGLMISTLKKFGVRR